jgi:hypothetical protein
MEGSTPVPAMSRQGARRWGAAALAFALVTGAAVVGAAPAQAASINMSCKIFNSTIPWTGTVTGTLVPAKPKAGQKASLTVKFSDYKNGPVPVTANSVQTVLTLNINGSTVTAKGGTNPTALGPDAPFPVPSTKVQFKAKSGSNKVTLTKVVFDYLPADADTNCTNKGAAPTVVSFTAASATTSNPTPTPTPSATQTAEPTETETPTAEATTGGNSDNNGGKKGNLAKTGPEDATRTMLIALVAIQVGLIAWFRWGRKPAYAGSHRGARR